MTNHSGWHLKRLGSQKIFIILEDGRGEGDDPVKAGSIVIYRRNAKHPSVYETIYDAWRSRREIIDRYGPDGRESGELSGLAETRERLQTAGLDLLADDGGAAGGRLTRRINRVARDLKHKSSPLKSAARLKAKAGPVRTSKNRKVNRMATHARVTAIDNRLAERQEEVYSILPWIKAQEEALRLEIDRSFELAGRLVRDIGSMTAAHEFFVRGRTTPNQLKGIVARLYLLKRELERLEAEPFRSFRRLAEAALDRAAVAVAANDAADAERHLDDVIAATDRVLLQHGVEALIAAVAAAIVSGPDRKRLGQLERQAGQLAALCAEPDLRPAWGPHADAIGDTCRLLAGDNLPPAGDAEAVTACLEAVKDALKETSRRIMS